MSALPQFTPEQLQSLPLERLQEIAELTAQIRFLSETNKLADYRPYPKQADFHAQGSQARERLFMAGNQLGKTIAGAFEAAMHLTGRYPDGWTGHRFTKGIRMWAGGKNGRAVRDALQVLLLGANENWGTGAVPRETLIPDEVRMARGTPGLVDSFKVQHVSGEVSALTFKTYEEGRESWQAATLDLIWFDEEPPLDIYTEGLTRTNATKGIVYVTFTPLNGVTDVVKRFLMEKLAGTAVTQMTIHDALHYTPEEREAIIATYPPFERDARTKGIPQLGSGRVFPIDEDDLKCAPFSIPDHWPQIAGLDFGWDHPSAAVRMAWDRDGDVLYITACHRQRQATPAMFAASVRPWGDWLPWAWPHDGLQHDKGSGDQLKSLYAQQGLSMLPMRATFEDGGFGVEAGVAEMLDRMQTGRWKVFSHLAEWFEEFNLYHRKDGLIVKEGDDLLSASRYAMMMRRFAIVRAKPGMNRRPNLGRVGNPQGWMG